MIRINKLPLIYDSVHQILITFNDSNLLNLNQGFILLMLSKAKDLITVTINY